MPNILGALGWTKHHQKKSGELGYPPVPRGTLNPDSKTTQRSPLVGDEFLDAQSPSPSKTQQVTSSSTPNNQGPDENLSSVDVPRGTSTLSAIDEINPPLPPDAPPSPKRAIDAPPERNLPNEVFTTVTPLPKPVAPRIMVIANQKGGVGKTTTAVNIAVALAQGGLNVILIDLDPQGNASTAVGVDHRGGIPGSYEVLIGGQELEKLLVSSPEADTLRVLPASLDLAAAELELVSISGRERRLFSAINTFLTTNDVDYVFIDCPPSLGLITVNAMVAASELLVPIQAEYYALEGLSQLLHSIDLVKNGLNTNLYLSTVILTMFDARTRLSNQVAEEVRNHFPAETLDSVIPRSVRISEAPGFGQSVITYDPQSVGSSMYRAAATEIAQRGSLKPSTSAPQSVSTPTKEQL